MMNSGQNRPTSLSACRWDGKGVWEWTTSSIPSLRLRQAWAQISDLCLLLCGLDFLHKDSIVLAKGGHLCQQWREWYIGGQIPVWKLAGGQ